MRISYRHNIIKHPKGATWRLPSTLSEHGTLWPPSYCVSLPPIPCHSLRRTVNYLAAFCFRHNSRPYFRYNYGHANGCTQEHAGDDRQHIPSCCQINILPTNTSSKAWYTLNNSWCAQVSARPPISPKRRWISFLSELQRLPQLMSNLQTHNERGENIYVKTLQPKLNNCHKNVPGMFTVTT